jgi:hypothetical protein
MSRFDRSSERGAILIQVAVALLGLTVFSAFVLDYGVLWSARGQAQNAADAGAMSAAVNLMWNPTDTAAAVVAARKMANANAVWGELPQTPNILVQTGLTCPPGSGGGPGCVRVDVMRGATDRNGGAHTNVLPTFFANLVGIQSQAIQATATAQVTSGNAVQCIKPWILPDKWVDNDESSGGWNSGDTFTSPPDTYSRSSGFKYPDNQGQEVLLKGDANAWSSGWVQEIDFGVTGSSAYNEEIHGCPNWVPTVSIYDGSVPCANKTDDDPVHGCVSVKPGVSQGPTSSGVADLIALDTASWNTSTNSVDSQCMTNDNCKDFYGNYVAISPRIVPVALFDPAAYWTETQSCSGTNCVAQVSNIFGFFLEGMCDDVYPNQATRPAFCGTNSEAKKTVVGRMMQYPGQYNGGSTVSSFAKAIRLVR